jgi:transposase
MEAYPLSIRKKIIEKYNAGLDTADIAEDFGYCVSGVRRIRQRFKQTGSLLPRQSKPGRKPALDAAALQTLAEAVRHKPDATLAELRKTVGVAVDISVYCRALKKLDLTRKKSRCTPRSRAVRI